LNIFQEASLEIRKESEIARIILGEEEIEIGSKFRISNDFVESGYASSICCNLAKRK
jgi:hypothetical protein